jgi:argininosuccinate lyase
MTDTPAKPPLKPLGGSAPKPWEHAKQGPGSASDELATRFVQSLSHDRRLYKQDIAGSLAHARMLQKVGLLTAQELQRIEQGLAQIQAEIEASAGEFGAAWPGWKPELEDVHMCLEAALIERVGEPGRKLHTGRSRNDQVALDLKLWIEEADAQLRPRFDALFRTFVALARRDGLIVMPSYTHLQRAQPIVVGGELIAWLAAFDRAQQRLAALRTINHRNPLGSGAIAGTSLPLDRHHTAAALGIGPPTPSSIDATASRDAAIDFVYALAVIAMTLSRWAEQWIIYASTEFGFLCLDPRYTTGSSMMPQKSNPDVLELIRGRCGAVYGHLVALLTICKGLPIGYNRDLQEDKRHVFEAFDRVVECLDMAARVVATARFDEDKINRGLSDGFLDATCLAEYLVSKAVPFRTAHQVVGSLVLQCQKQGRPELSRLTVEEINGACTGAGIDGRPCGPDVYEWLGPRNAVRRYVSYGNAGVRGFQEQLEAWEKRLSGV